MEDLNNNSDVQEQVREEVNTTQKMGKEAQAEQFLKSLEQNKKQVKSKTISFKCNLKDYILIRSKAILNNVSMADYIIDLVQKDKNKKYKDLEEKMDSFLS
ncbi:hypothetical protein [Streptococcus agalactiae]|jgi:ABC-type Fe3+-hydroxamate transport system substrate-binding protein|uniref:hypothetical protein n=1 Tax=Streptococcus agalactiae TaxID=1311 RepID=UPI000B9C0AE8|nr:hypothetical protein [Streptococcus agalactiae]OXT31360.1 hypothetical protein B1H61_11515 [Streptococcus agalactiae]